MAKQQLQVTLDLKTVRPAHFPQDDVAGVVSVTAPADCRIDGIELNFHAVHFETSRRAGDTSSELAKGFRMKQGETKTFPFLFVPPADPFEWSQDRKVAPWNLHLLVRSSFPDLRLDVPYVIARKADQYQPPTGDQPVKTGRQDADWSTVAIVLLFSLIAWAFTLGGMALALNGFSHKAVPLGIRVFGLLASLGGLYALQKMYEQLWLPGEVLCQFVSAVAMVAGGLGFYAYGFDHDFSIHPFAASPDGAQSVLAGRLDMRAMLGLLAGLLYSVSAGMSLSRTDPRREGALVLAMVVPGWLGVVLCLGMLPQVVEARQVTGGFVGIAMWAAIGVPGVVIALRRPDFGNMPPGLTLFSAAPLLVVAGVEVLALMNGRSGGLGPAIVIGLSLLGAAVILVIGNRNLIVGLRLGKIEARPNKTVVAPGGHLEVAFSLRPRGNTRLHGFSVRAVCEKSRARNFSTDRSAEFWTEWDRTTTGQRTGDVAAGQTVTETVQVLFPAGCAQSGSDTSWELRLRVDVPGIDWEQVVPITVKAG